MNQPQNVFNPQIEPPQHSIVSLVKIGFFIGCGFAVSASIVFFMLAAILGSLWSEEWEEEYEMADYYTSTEAEIEEMRQLKADILNFREIENGLEFLGAINNNGNAYWQSVTIEVELFDEQGEFIDETSAPISGFFAPGTKHNFKLGFYGCDSTYKIAFKDYKVSVIAAY